MAAVSQKSKKQKVKPPKSRPPTTSSISQAAVEDAWSSTILSSFSPTAELFVFVSLGVDKHRLRVYDVKTNQATAEHEVEQARVTSLAWISFSVSEDRTALKQADSPHSKKRKKTDKIATNSSTPTSSSTKVQAVAIGLSDGRVQIFSPVHRRVVRSLTPSSANSPVLSITSANGGGDTENIWTSSSDGILRLWDVQKGEVLRSHSEGQSPYSALAVRPGVEDDQTQLLVANHSIQLLSSLDDSSISDASEADTMKELCSFSGHASAVKAFRWDTLGSPAKRFFSSAEDDRFVYIWEVPEPTSSKGKMVASCPLDSDVRQIEVVSSAGKQILLSLSTSGKITLSPVPSELTSSTGSKHTKHQVPTLLPRSTITFSSKRSTSDVRVVSAAFSPTGDGRICIALLSGGVKLGFDTLDYLDNSGEFVSEINLQPKNSIFEASKSSSGPGIANQRYSEGTNLAIFTGDQTPHDPSLDAAVEDEVEGALDVDLAEMSLGERLAARSAGDANTSGAQRSSGSDAEDGAPSRGGGKKKKNAKDRELVVPAHSLTRTLIQALHSSDTGLLEACFAHSDETLIRNTVARLPPQLTIPLLNACMERLGRGGRGNNMKGRGGAASAQKGMVLIKWVKAVLAIHSGHLMTMPDLVARLSALHSTLTSRLTLQERLLSLSGRLDLVLSQVELRSGNAPAPLPVRSKNIKKRGTAKAAQKYVEGESSDEEEEGEQMEVELEGGDDDDEGSIEDVELGGESDSEDGDEDESEGEDDEDDSDEDDEDNLVNGFIDDEAEENYEDDESEQDSE